MKTNFTFSAFRLPEFYFFKNWLRISSFLLVYLSLTSLAHGQAIEWQKTIGYKFIGSGGNAEITTVQQTTDGGYILGGYSTTDRNQAGKAGNNYWVIKLKADGSKDWDKTFGGDKQDLLTVVQQTQDGGYIVGGTSDSGKSGDKTEAQVGAPGDLLHDYWIVKLDAKGIKQWDKTIGGSSNDFLTSMQQTQDGGYILGGQSYSNISGDKSEVNRGSLDYWAVKLDAKGQKEWDKTVGGNNFETLITIQQASNGSYILGGNSSSDKGGDKTQNNKGEVDYWVVKLSAGGEKEWDKTLGGTNRDELVALQPTQDGGFILGGSSSSAKSGDKSENGQGYRAEDQGYIYYNPDYWVVKLDAAGTKQWDKTIGGNFQDYLKSIQQTQDGGYILGGTSFSEVSGDKSEANKSLYAYDYWIVKLAANGNKQWDQTIGGDASEDLYSIKQTNDKGYILVGTSASGKGGDKTEEEPGFWIVKLKATSNQTQTITFAPLSNKTIFDKPLTLTATASSGLPVSFRVASGPATIKDNIVTLTGGGTVTIVASQPGNAAYRGAVEVTRSFIVDVPTVKIWDRTLGGSQSDKLSTMIRTPDGGYLLGGSSNSGKTWDKSQSSQGSTDYWIVKLDSSGNKLWDKTYGGAGTDEMKALVATPDGGYLLGGTSVSGKSGDKSQSSKGKADYWVIKVDGSGTPLWDKTIGSDSTDTFTALVTTPDGGFLLGGYTRGGIGGDKTQPSQDNSEYPYFYGDYWVVKLDSQGRKVWDKTYGGTRREELSGIAVVDGGYVLSGISSSNRLPIDYDLVDVWLIKIDETGQVIWKNFYYQGPEYQYYNANIIATTDGNLLVSGYAADYYFYVSVNTVFKINPKGEKIWSYDYTPTGSFPFTPFALTNTADGNYLLGSGEWIRKLDTNGAVIYTKSYNNIVALLNTADGGYLLGGSSTGNRNVYKSEDNKGQEDYWVLKIKEADTPPVLDKNWDHRFGGSWHDKLTTTIRTFDGGYVAAGYSRSPKSGDKTQSRIGLEDYWLVKTDEKGQKLWDKRFGGPRHDFLNQVIQTSDGGYLLGGSSDSNMGGDKSQNSQGGRDYWVIRLDKNGNKVWDKRYGGSGYEDLRQMKQLPSGGFILAGYSNSPVSGDKSQPSKGGQDYWIVQIDARGQKQWDKTYGGSADDFLQDVILWNKGGYILGGSSDSPRSGNKTQGSRGGRDFWIVRLDNTGEKVWDRTFGGTGQDNLSALEIDYSYLGGTFNFVVAGSSDSPAGRDKTHPGKGQTDYWLLRINAAGEKYEDYTYGGSGSEELHALTYVYGTNGYLLGGTSYSGKSGDKSQESQGNGDYWVVRTDLYGKKLTDQRLGGSELDELRTVIQTDANEFLLAGRSESGVSGNRTQPSRGQSDYWLIRTSLGTEPLASEKAVIVAARSESTIDTPATVTLEQNLVAYPNPFQEKVTVSFAVETTQPVSLQAYNSQGRKVATIFQGQAQAKQRYEVEWQAKNQATGLYFLRLQTAGKVQHQKVLLTK